MTRDARPESGSAQQWVDEPSVQLRFPVHVRAACQPGHADERDRLTARHAVADRRQHRTRVVVARLEPTAVLDADPDAAFTVELPSRLGHDAGVRRDDGRSEWRRDVDAAVRKMEELRDRPGHRPEQVTRTAIYLREALRERHGHAGGIAAHDLVAAEHGEDVVLTIRTDGAAEEAAVRTEAAHAKDVGEDGAFDRWDRPHDLRLLV